MTKRKRISRRKRNAHIKKMLAKAHGLHATWELTVERQKDKPYGTKESLLNLKNFMRSNKGTVSWKKMGLSQTEVLAIQNAIIHHQLIELHIAKQKERLRRRYVDKAA